jgi:hypothetical protein
MQNLLDFDSLNQYFDKLDQNVLCCVSVLREQTRREVSEDKFSVITCCEMEGHRHRSLPVLSFKFAGKSARRCRGAI